GYKGDVTFGKNFDGSKGNIVISAGWSHSSAVKSKNRPGTDKDNTALCAYDDTPVTSEYCEQAVVGTYSSYGPSGHFFVGSKGYGITSGTGADATVGTWSTSNMGFNRDAWRLIEVPVDRLTISANGHYDFSNTLQGYVETTFASTSSSQNMEPSTVDSGVSTNLLHNDGISVDNPYMPAALRQTAVSAGLTSVPFTRRMLELGPRHSDARRDTYRVVVGMKGTLLGDYNWDLSYNWGHTLATQNGTGQYNVSNFRNALNATTQADGSIVCADAIARDEGCVPINIFGTGSISAEAAKYISAPQSRTQNIDQKILAGQVEGKLLTLPAGDVHLVTGFEWRRESASDVPDALTQQGMNGSNQQAATRGHFAVAEGFAETEVPVLKDLPFAKELTLGAAWRWSSYTKQGDTNAYTGRASWSPVEDLRFRVQYARAVRAPNINEMFSPGGENYASVSDPCDGVTSSSVGNVARNCLADPYIASRIARDGIFKLTTSEQQSAGGFDQTGSETLKPEIGNTWSYGVVYSHDFGSFGSVVASVDYYDISISNYIGTVGRQTAIDMCYNSASMSDNKFCNMIVRSSLDASLGVITKVNTSYINNGWVKTTGLNTEFSYQLDLNEISPLRNGALVGLSDAGQFSAHFNWNWLQSFTEESLGEITKARGDVYDPVHRVNATFTYTNGAVSLQWETQFRSGTREQATPDATFYTLKHPSYFLNDVSGSYQLTEEVQFYVGVNNVLDQKAPIILSGINSNVTGTNTAADVFDAIGRRYYFGLRYKV
ncbi:MAG: TonB-dependent receptor, partial [Rhizomicrobium sp.]